jgi:hypothetical protein
MLLPYREKVVLTTLRVRGRRERGGLDIDGLVAEIGLSSREVALLLMTLQQRLLVCSALVDGRESMITRQRRLWYLTKSALASP